MRYRIRRSAWQVWMWFWGALIGMFWPAALPLGNTGKGIAVAVWLACAATVAVVVFSQRRGRVRR